MIVRNAEEKHQISEEPKIFKGFPSQPDQATEENNQDTPPTDDILQRCILEALQRVEEAQLKEEEDVKIQNKETNSVQSPAFDLTNQHQNIDQDYGFSTDLVGGLLKSDSVEPRKDLKGDLLYYAVSEMISFIFYSQFSKKV